VASLFSIEPMIPTELGIGHSNLPNLVLDLERKAARLDGMVKPVTARVLEKHMRVINSYYSNLIEGHGTHPHDIRKAMEGNYSDDPAKRDLQLESLAHIAVQQHLMEHPPGEDYFLSAQCISDIHRTFYKELPESLRFVEGFEGEKREVIPGAFRKSGEEVKVGRHIPPAGSEVSKFLARFAEAYRIKYLHGHKRVIAAMASHHRLAWIHPFLDGNGRVCRLHTDLFLKTIGLGACGTWCLSRGLARKSADYKAMLARADHPRMGDRDGRGGLSEACLIEFCEFMITTAIDQVEYMTEMLDLHNMERRIQAYIDDRNKGLVRSVGKIRPEAVRLIERAFLSGEFPRADMNEISGLGVSVTRKLVQQLKEEGLLTETSSRSPLRWAIPPHAERYYLPELAPPP
jgi:Fic family protein